MEGLDKILFLKALLSLNKFPQEIHSIEDLRNGKPLYVSPASNFLDSDHQCYLVQDVPAYCKLHLDPNADGQFIRTVATQKTYVVELDRYKNGELYIQNHFGPKSRSALKRYKKRFETCFTVHYHMYHGPMDREKYDELFVQLKELMVRRFEQKNEQNYELQHLNEIKGDVYPKLLQKQASLYVIYANDRPVSIRINMMKEKLAFYILSAYDPDYDVFRLGKLDMWLNIAWLIAQGYTSYDLLKGYGYIKERWADRTYSNNLIFINRDPSILGSIKFNTLVWKTQFKVAAVKTAKVVQLHTLWKKWQGIRRHSHGPNIEVVLVDISTSARKGKRIIGIDTLGDGLKKTVFQLAYKHQVPVGQMLIFENQNRTNEFYVQFLDVGYVLKKLTD